MKFIKRKFLKFLAINLFQPLYEMLHFIALKGMNYGSANDPNDSGEVSLLNYLKKEIGMHPVIFDVGSNNGQYLGLLLIKLKDLEPTIHCFEPNHTAFFKLQEKYSNHKNVILNKFALGDENKTAILYSSTHGDVQSSLIELDLNAKYQEMIEIKTLDSYCLEQKISKIDFLKIDTEGFETNVINGAKDKIAHNSIKRIQLEHGSLQSVIAQASLYKYKQLLPNFKIYHIKQNGIREIIYNTRFEIFYNSNYFFKL